MDRKKFLFLGNSHTYFNDMPELFRRMCREGGFCEAEVFALTVPFAAYADHLRMETSLRYALVYGGFNYLIMQQRAHIPCPSREETLRDGGEIIRQARAYRITPVQTVPWAEQRCPERQAEINALYDEFQKQYGVPLIPLGDVFQAAEKSGAFPCFYWRDGEHASPWGSYAAAATIYAALSGTSPEGLSPVSLSFAKDSDARGQADWASVPCPLDPAACGKLQRLIWKTVCGRDSSFFLNGR